MSSVLVVRGAADAGAIRRALPGVLVRESTDLGSPLPADSTVVVLRSGLRLGRCELDALPRLRHVVRTGSGIDHIDVNALRGRGIRLHRNAEAGADAVGEWVLAAALSLSRRIPLGQHALQLGRHEKQACAGVPLGTLTAGIWGAGPVGLAAGRALAPHVAGTAYAAWPSNPPGLRELSPTALAEQSHVHVVALPLRPTTRRVVGEEFLARVAPQRPLLICAGRLETLDVTACLRALANGRLSGLALDPVEQAHLPLLAAATSTAESLNLLVSPHIGAQRSDVRSALDRWAVDLLREITADDVGVRDGGRW
ncbi:NAD(P)-dependent oxidoreductase [Streptomyces sp. MUSC 125]|uniref:NAD(P)-dependent oxidoreductase n=1 Tax=Streptomyces sp. MUSC 125 TaxID=1428624 RepID=UPI000691405A|nr:NAD(P)-dependent oxidoreductase [Streptomyces sp. MUSC 125]